MNIISLPLLILSLNPVEDVVRDRVDVIEVHHFYNDQGKHVHDQIIFWDWHPHKERLVVRAWRLARSHNEYPTKDWERGCYSATWLDNHTTLRRVEAASIRETWLQHDPETVEQERTARELRIHPDEITQSKGFYRNLTPHRTK